MIIDEGTSDEKYQNEINRGSAKISALLINTNILQVKKYCVLIKDRL